MKKLSKREQAAVYRHAAKVVERDGWTTGTLHLLRTPRNSGGYTDEFPQLNGLTGVPGKDKELIETLQQCKHCAAGAVSLAALEGGKFSSDSYYGYADDVRNLLAEQQVALAGMDLGRYRIDLEMAVKRAEEDGAPCPDYIVTLNDNVIRDMVKSNEQAGAKTVAAFFRKVARHLEHGGG